MSTRRQEGLCDIGVEYKSNDYLQSARNVFAVAADTGVGNWRPTRSTLSGAAVTNRLTEA